MEGQLGWPVLYHGCKDHVSELHAQAMIESPCSIRIHSEGRRRGKTTLDLRITQADLPTPRIARQAYRRPNAGFLSSVPLYASAELRGASANSSIAMSGGILYHYKAQRDEREG
jgi:hypothetical protein